VAWTLTKLAVPLFMSSFSVAALRTTDSAVLGHASTYALAVFSVADIWMKISGQLFSGRVLSSLRVCIYSVTPIARPGATRTILTRTYARRSNALNGYAPHGTEGRGGGRMLYIWTSLWQASGCRCRT
jgi:hypothetical protein